MKSSKFNFFSLQIEKIHVYFHLDFILITWHDGDCGHDDDFDDTHFGLAHILPVVVVRRMHCVAAAAAADRILHLGQRNDMAAELGTHDNDAVVVVGIDMDLVVVVEVDEVLVCVRLAAKKRDISGYFS